MAKAAFAGHPALSIKERNLLVRLFITKNWTALDIAEKYGVSERFVYRRMQQHGISKTGATAKKHKYCPTCGHFIK